VIGTCLLEERANNMLTKVYIVYEQRACGRACGKGVICGEG